MCESGTSVPREQRFLCGMAFSIYEVVRVACQSFSDHTKKGQTNWLFTILHGQTGRFTVCAMQMVTKIQFYHLLDKPVPFCWKAAAKVWN